MSYEGSLRQRRRSFSSRSASQFTGSAAGMRGNSRSPSRTPNDQFTNNSGPSIRTRSRSPGLMMRGSGGGVSTPRSAQPMMMGVSNGGPAFFPGAGVSGAPTGLVGGAAAGGIHVASGGGQVFTGNASLGSSGGGGCGRRRTGKCEKYCVCPDFPVGGYGYDNDCYDDCNNGSNCCNSNCCWGSGSSCCWGGNGCGNSGCGSGCGCAGCGYGCCDRKAGCTILWAIVLLMLIVGILMALAPFMVAVTAAGTFFAAPYAASAWYSYYPATIVALAWVLIFLALAIAFWASDWVRCIGCCNDNAEYVRDNGWFGFDDSLGCVDGYNVIDGAGPIGGGDCGEARQCRRGGLVIDWVILSWVIATVWATVLVDAWLDTRRVAYQLPVIVYLDETLVDIAVFYLVYHAMLGRLNFWINLIVTVIVTSIIVSVRYAILGFGTTYSVGGGLLNVLLLFIFGALFGWIWDICRLQLRLDVPDCGPVDDCPRDNNCAPEFIGAGSYAGTAYPFANGATVASVASAGFGGAGPVRTVPYGAGADLGTVGPVDYE